MTKTDQPAAEVRAPALRAHIAGQLRQTSQHDTPNTMGPWACSSVLQMPRKRSTMLGPYMKPGPARPRSGPT